MAERDVILDAYALNPEFRTNSIRLPGPGSRNLNPDPKIKAGKFAPLWIDQAAAAAVSITPRIFCIALFSICRIRSADTPNSAARSCSVA